MLKLKATADEMTLAQDFLSTVPVSFTYDGLPFADSFTGASGDFVSKDGKVRVTFPFITFEDSAAVEWVPRFSAVGNQPTAQIRNIYALDHVFPVDGDVTLYYCKGNRAAIDNFEFQVTALSGEPFVMDGTGSCGYLPFMNLQTGSGGVLLGLGFTGSWRMTFTPMEGGIRVTAEISPTDFHLLPGESVRHIRMLVQFWQGDVERSFNLLRNHLVVNCIPKDADGEIRVPIFCNTWGGMKTHNHLKYLQYIKDNDLKFDGYWIDAGWHGPDHDAHEFQNFNYEDWAYNQGDWSVNRTIHPDGLKPIADTLKSMNMKFLLWFGTACCNEGIGWYKDHPEWSCDKGALTEFRYIGANRQDMTIIHQLDFGVSEARKWLAEAIGNTLLENGVDYYREDCWYAGPADTEGRAGISEMKSVEYLYEFWDDLRARVPGLIVENCGGGASRVDLETVRRSITAWRSDYNCVPDADPIGAQVANYGIGHFVPLINGAPPSRPGNTYNLHSGIYGPMSFGLFHPCGWDAEDHRLHTWISDDYPVAWHKEMLVHLDLAKPYLTGNFYGLTPSSTATDIVVSYQFDRPDLGSGIILTFFRQDVKTNSISIRPRVENGRYRVENVVTKETFEFEADDNRKITVTADKKPFSVMLHYTKLD